MRIRLGFSIKNIRFGSGRVTTFGEDLTDPIRVRPPGRMGQVGSRAVTTNYSRMINGRVGFDLLVKNIPGSDPWVGSGQVSDYEIFNNVQ